MDEIVGEFMKLNQVRRHLDHADKIISITAEYLGSPYCSDAYVAVFKYKGEIYRAKFLRKRI